MKISDKPRGTREKNVTVLYYAVKDVGRGALDVWLPQEVASFTFLKVAVHLANGVMQLPSVRNITLVDPIHPMLGNRTDMGWPVSDNNI